MGKRNVIIRAIEFLCAAAIGGILSQSSFSKFWTFAPIVVCVAAILYEYRAAVADRQSRIKSQLTLLMRLLAFESKLDVRCTYHVPVGRKQLHQVFDYIPSGGGAGRKFSQGKGIIGKTFADKGWSVENFQDDTGYREQMIAKYNYTAEELRNRRADRRSYFCYSLVDENNNVLGLIYFDSSQPNTFTYDETDLRTKMIIDACEVIKNSLL